MSYLDGRAEGLLVLAKGCCTLLITSEKSPNHVGDSYGRMRAFAMLFRESLPSERPGAKRCSRRF